jgi:hypothetical protein
MKKGIHHRGGEVTARHNRNRNKNGNVSRKARKACPEQVEGFAQFPQIPHFPPLSKGEERGFWIALRQTDQLGSMKISSQLANNFGYCSAEILFSNSPSAPSASSSLK